VAAGRLVVQLRWITVLACWALFLLGFVEPPSWCREASNLNIIANQLTVSNKDEYGDCDVLLHATGTTIDGQENRELYPSTKSMILTYRESKFIEIFGLCVVSFFMLLKLADDGFRLNLFFYSGKKRRLNTLQLAVLAGLSFCTAIDAVEPKPILRMLLLASFLRGFQKEFFTVVQMIPQMSAPLSILAIIILFYGWFGTVIFYQTEQGIESFPNIFESCWTLWIMVTTANYPDVSMPSVNDNRLAVVYFFSFMVLSFFYVMNLILAVAVNAYDDNLDERKKSRAELSRALLTEAFKLLAKGNDDSVSKKSLQNVMTILNQDIPEIKLMSQEDKDIVHAFLDRDGSESISLEEFLQLGNVLLLEFSKESEYTTFIKTRYPAFHASSFFKKLSETIQSAGFEWVIDTVLGINAIVILRQDHKILLGEDVSLDPHTNDGVIDSFDEGLETVFTMIYVVEAMLKILVLGRKKYFESPRNIFDFGITVMAISASAYVYYPNLYSNSALIKYIIMARVLRLLRLLFAVPIFRIFGAVSLEIIPTASDLGLVLLFLSYLFASLGVIFFGGKITRDPDNPLADAIMMADDFVNNQYWPNNFNDILSGMNVLFNWLVINNWPTQMEAIECVTSNKWLARIYFLSFYVFGVIGCMNAFTSFIINTFFQHLRTLESRLEEEDITGEVTLKGAKALFDPSVIRGTSTGLRKTLYYARMRPIHHDVELDTRAELRKLFTRQGGAY